MTPRLTIVMPLKGRDPFTFRFLWYANKVRLPYRFLIADGQVNTAVARRLENSRAEFPELDIEYVRYPDDVDFSHYFRKMSDAMRRVRTPYVMHADNDDFLGYCGIERSLDFLDTNADYGCARARVLNFAVRPQAVEPHKDLYGRFNRFYLHGDFRDIVAPTAGRRLQDAGLCNALYYAIYRTETLARTWNEVVEIDFSDLTLHENYFALRALTYGKVYTTKHAISYYSQSGTGISYQPLLDWAGHLIRSRFTSEARDVIDRISLAAANGDDSARTIAEDVTTILETHYRNFLSMNYGLPAQIKRTMRKKWPRLVNGLRSRPRLSVGRELTAALATLKAAGASEEELRRTRTEIATIDLALAGADQLGHQHGHATGGGRKPASVLSRAAQSELAENE
jgi:glycosyltransferase domain-containing protein